VAAADYDGDGYVDLALSDLGERDVVWWSGTAEGDPVPAGRTSLDADPTDLGFADVTGDGLPDLLATEEASGLHVWAGTAGGTLAAPIRTTTGLEPVDLEAADLRGDGCWSVLTANASGAGVSLLLGLGDGTFTSSDPVNVGAVASALTVAQLDGGGPLDVAVTDPYQLVLHVFVGSEP
jgi:hypothetical protein